MTFTLETYLRSIWLSIMEPVEIAKQVLSFHVTANVLWTVLALASVLHVLLSVLILTIVPVEDAVMSQIANRSPFEFLIITGSFIVAFVPALYFAGMTLDGEGGFEDTLKIVAWFQVVSVTVKAAHSIILLLSTGVGAIFGLMTSIALFWCIAHFTFVLHQFKNKGLAFVAVIMAAIGAGVVAIILAALLGIDPRVEAE